LTDATGILVVVEKRLHPTKDPNCQKYIDDPNRQWYKCRWATKGSIERIRERENERHRERRKNDPVFLAKERESGRLWRLRNPDKIAARNSSRIMVAGMYLGKLSFTDLEVKEMIGGKTD
jgi:hypothetical protein